MAARKLLSLLGAAAFVVIALLFGSAVSADTEAANLKGQIFTLDLKAKTLQVLKSDNSIVTVSFNKTTQILRNGKSAKIKALLLRDGIQVKAKNGAASKFTATGPSSKKLAGKLSNALKGAGLLTVNGKNILATAQTRIVRNGQAASLSSLTRNDSVVAHLRPNSTEVATASEAFDVISNGPEDDELHGTISAIAGNQVTISPLNGTSDVTLNVTDTTMIEVDGEDAALADLTVGMEIEAHFDPATLDAFVIETDSHDEDDDAHITGTVSAVDVVGGTITITPENAGDPVTLTVDAATEIEVNDNHGGLEDIEVGMPARAEYDTATLRAKEIHAGEDFGGHNGGGGHDGNHDNDEDVRGTITAIDLDAATVTITPENGGAALVLNVTAESEIRVQDHDDTIQDLQVGQSVRVEYFPDTNNISELKVENGGGHEDEDGKVVGVVAAVDLGASTLTINVNGSDTDVTVNVTPDTELEVNGEAAVLADVELGENVKAEYDTATNNASEVHVGTHLGGGDNDNDNDDNDNGDNDNGDNDNGNGNENVNDNGGDNGNDNGGGK